MFKNEKITKVMKQNMRKILTYIEKRISRGNGDGRFVAVPALGDKGY
jgi:hypothetical protein